MQYPKIMQPTHARWEQLLPTLVPSKFSQRRLAQEGNASGMDQLSGGEDQTKNETAVTDTMFPEVPPVFSRNFMIADVRYVSPPLSGLGYPGPDHETIDIDTGGLARIPDNVLAELPFRCRQSFEDVRSEEIRWKASWRGEAMDCARGQLRISYNA